MKLKIRCSQTEHMFYNGCNLLSKDVTNMHLVSPQIKTQLQTAYQKNQITSLIAQGITYTGTVDYISATTVYLGLAAGHSRSIPLSQISQVHSHQLRPWWYLYD